MNTQESTGGRAVSHAAEEGPRSPTPQEGGSVEQEPGMGARTPAPQDLPEGLFGYLISKTERVAYLPVIGNPNEGNGAVGRLLQDLVDDHDVIVIAEVGSERLAGMLHRRDFHQEIHWAPEFGARVSCFVWRRRSDGNA